MSPINDPCDGILAGPLHTARIKRERGPSTQAYGYQPLQDETANHLLRRLQDFGVNFELFCSDCPFIEPFFLSDRRNISLCYLQRIGKGAAATRSEDMNRHCGMPD